MNRLYNIKGFIAMFAVLAVLACNKKDGEITTTAHSSNHDHEQKQIERGEDDEARAEHTGHEVLKRHDGHDHGEGEISDLDRPVPGCLLK